MASAIDHRTYAWPKLQPGQLARAIPRVLAAAGRTETVEQTIVKLSAEGEQGIVESDQESTINELDARFADVITSSVYFGFDAAGYDSSILISFRAAARGEALELGISARTAAEVISIRSLLEGQLGLKEWEEPPLERGDAGDVKKAADDLVRSSKLAAARTENIKCFFAHRFGEPDAALASEVQRFLTAAGCDVRTGGVYEPRSVSEKVRGLISEDLDLIVVLIGPSGQSGWTRDEMSRASTLGVPVVPLVVNDESYDAGLHGDNEYIPFDRDHLGEGYVKLLQAIEFARKKRADRVRSSLATGGES